MLQETSHLHPDNGGKENELLWVEFFRKIIPNEFAIVHGGRIIGPDGEPWPQLDILILRPGAEKRLDAHGYYPSSTVLAAFECKLSLKAAHIKEAAENAALIKRMTGDFSYSTIDDAIGTDFPYYGLIGTGLARGLSWDLNELKSKVLDVCALYHPKLALDFIFINDFSCLNVSFQVDQFEEDFLDCGVRSGNFYDPKIDAINIPIIGLSLFLTRLISKVKPEYVYLAEQYEFYERCVVTMFRRAFEICRSEEGIRLV
ncbi:DUF6602 domain-containing protein [Paraburkholderia largidicola]|uniref:DUF6602 domain-containing protein n=1 Tax=Paraburkholderia largidicola TaxID=3014751 RepID=A0A7I8BLG7_9BURK|nr:DUF6602 domain-containing protein [Paraburkholderia sp. PGU16]BCF89099.1 hypothetical protein PPGU16_21660 [Paraburkholderia sp. PGU16]